MSETVQGFGFYVVDKIHWNSLFSSLQKYFRESIQCSKFKLSRVVQIYFSFSLAILQLASIYILVYSSMLGFNKIKSLLVFLYLFPLSLYFVKKNLHIFVFFTLCCLHLSVFEDLLIFRHVVFY